LTLLDHHVTDLLVASARQRLNQAVGYLRKIDEPGRAVFHATYGAQEILKAACEIGDIAGTFPELAAVASQLVADACPVVAGEDGAPPPAQIYWGMGRINDLLVFKNPPSRVWLINHAGIFVAELTIALHRQHLRERGQVLFEHVVARQALEEASASPSAALH
jgi:hypothetical protein